MSAQTIEPIPWSEAQAASDADKSVAHTACIAASISLKGIIPSKVLVSILKGHEPIGKWGPYVGVFFGECPAKIMKGVVVENGLTEQDMEACYLNLPKFYQTPHFREIHQDVFIK